MATSAARIQVIALAAAVALGGLAASAPAPGRQPAPGSSAPQAFSPLAQITPGNVAKLRGAWLVHLEGGANDRAQEGTPVAVGGRLYVQTAQGDIFALDGATGQVIRLGGKLGPASAGPSIPARVPVAGATIAGSSAIRSRTAPRPFSTRHSSRSARWPLVNPGRSGSPGKERTSTMTALDSRGIPARSS
jgi:outer membrane protein assembly factor BamB